MHIGYRRNYLQVFKNGILTSDKDVISTELVAMTHSPNKISEKHLINDTMPADGRCTLKEYLKGDNELQVCVNKGGDDWESSFFAGAVLEGECLL